jgi:acetyl esterase/lipase
MSVLRFIKKRADKSIAKKGEFPEASYPVPDDLTEIFNVEYAGRDGNILTADIIRPKAVTEDKLPVLILIHGGGLFVGCPIMERPAAEAFARLGYLVFVPSYRMFTDADACGEISDICSAFDFAVSMLEEYGGDADNINVLAESAGAFLTEYATAMTGSSRLCELIGYEPSRITINAIAFVSGMFYTTRKDLIGIIYPREIYGDRRKDREFMEYMDPEHPEVIKSLPPAIIVTSRNDPLHSYSLRYAEALKASGAESKLLYYADKDKRLVHAFVTMWPDLPESIEAMKEMDEWFRHAHDRSDENIDGSK